MKNKKKFKIISFIFWLFLFFNLSLSDCLALPPGALLFRTSSNGKMFGYSGDDLAEVDKGILKNIFPGHVGIYIGKENGVDYVVEALAEGIVKKPASQFVNTANGEKYLGAKMPRSLTAVQQAKAVAIAKSLADSNLTYDFDFKTQKGPKSGQWTCVGLVEKIYESANISNPSNLMALEYNQNYYAVDITADGLDHYSLVSDNGDCFSKDYEFSKIARRTNLLLPAPELIGFNLGFEKDGERYIFFPYTQFLQSELVDVPTDITISSSFDDDKLRGSVNNLSLVLRWSLINNPLSSLKVIGDKISDLALGVKKKMVNTTEEEMNVFLEEVVETVSPETVALAKSIAVINKKSEEEKEEEKEDKKEEELKIPRNEEGEIIVSEYFDQGEESIMALINKGLQAGLKEFFTTGKSSGVTGSFAEDEINEDEEFLFKEELETSSKEEVIKEEIIKEDIKIAKIATINRIYSTGNNDFIELCNPGDYDFDLMAEKYRLEKAKTAEDPSLILRFGNTDDASYPGGTVIKAHDTYLIVKETANKYYLDQADAIAKRSEFTWPSKGYTIYLGKGAISSTQDPDIIEAVGFGKNATYFQGNGPAQEIMENYILKRIHDHGHNNLDFILVKSDDPSIDWTSPKENENNNNNENNVEEETSSVIINENQATSTEELEVVTSSTEEVVATSSEEIVATSSLPCGRAIISRIYSRGDSDGIELYNPTEYSLDLAAENYRLEKAKTAEDPSLIMRIGSSSDGLYPGGTVIEPFGTYLISSSDASSYYLEKAQAIATRTEFSWFNSGYSFYLATSSISSSTDSDIVDLVGVGPNALYWQGMGPAPALKDNYVLTRISETKNNNLDFNLVKSDNPEIVWGGDAIVESSSNSIYTFSSDSYDLFSLPEPIISPSLTYLWHFDECYGSVALPAISSTSLELTPNWSVGKFGCAKKNGYDYGWSRAGLPQEIDLNSFSISFWFRKETKSPRLSLTLSNENDDFINLTLEDGLIQIDGLATPAWRNFMTFPFDETWRQAVLVVNREEGYWSLYIDGEEVFRVDTFKLLPIMNYLDVSGNNGSYRLDELAIWNRPLPEEEIIYLREAEQPFAPSFIPPPQEKAVLKHFWNFNEGIGTSSLDLIGNSEMNFRNTDWNNIDFENSSLLVSCCGNTNNASLAEINSNDLSLTYKWRPNSNKGERSKVSLRNETTPDIFSIVSGNFLSAYYFYGGRDYLSNNDDISIPSDQEWHDLALVYDSYRYQLNYYVDGVLKRQLENIWPPGKEAITSLEILSENWTSEIDDLGIWEGALSAKQVEEISSNN